MPTFYSLLNTVIAMSKSPDELHTLSSLNVFELQKLKYDIGKMAQACSKACKCSKTDRPELLSINVTDYTNSMDEEYREEVIGKLLDMQQNLSDTQCTEKQKDLLVEVYSNIREDYSLDTIEREELCYLFGEFSDSIGLIIDFE